jgi:RNA polymerase sigma factor for flagellar operon FliA
MSATLTASTAAKAWRAYSRDSGGDHERDVVERYLPLVRNVVDRMRVNLPPSLEIEDLYSAGITGLISAVQRYDPSQSPAFPAFATLRIRGAVLDELRRMDWMPRTRREKAKKLKQVIAEVEQRHGRPATNEEVSAELGLTAGEYCDLLDEVAPISFVPLDADASYDDTEELPLHEIIADESQTNARDAVEKRELLALVAQRIQQLPEVPKKVLAMYYFEEMRLSEIAAAFGLTEGRISQIHTQTVLGLRSFIEQMTRGVSRCC